MSGIHFVKIAGIEVKIYYDIVKGKPVITNWKYS